MSLYTVTFEPDSEYYSEEEGEDDGGQSNGKTKDSNKRRKKKILVKKRITKENMKNHPELLRKSLRPPTPPTEPTSSRPQLRRSRSKFTSSQSEENIKEDKRELFTTPQRTRRTRHKDDNSPKSISLSEEDKTESSPQSKDDEITSKDKRKPRKEQEQHEVIEEKLVSDNITNEIQTMKEDKKEELPIYDIIKYTIERSTKMSLRGSRTHFQIYQNGTPLYHSKIKSHGADEVIKIAKGTESHFSSTKFDGYLRSDGIFTNFSLRTGYECGDEKLVIRYFKGKRENEPRSVQCSIILDENIPKKIHLTSKKPEISDTGKWQVDDSLPQYAIDSIKNMVLISTKDNSSVRMIKTSKNSLEIEATENIPSLTVFSIGISDFLCKL